MATNNAVNTTLSSQTGTGSFVGSASPTFTGTVTVPTPFTLGATSVTSTGTQLNLLNGLTLVPINKVNAQLFATPGAFTYTPTSGMKYIIVTMTGAGGGGGGVTGVAAQTACAGGGASGGGYKFLMTAAQVGVSLSGSIGTGGTAGSTAGGNGGNGGNTTFGDWTGGGGNGGVGQVASNANKSATGGTPTASTAGTGTPMEVFVGQNGEDGWALNTAIAKGGSGAGSIFGTGAYGNVVIGISAPGIASNTAGAGASGAASNAATAKVGGIGSNGYVEIIEFISA